MTIPRQKEKPDGSEPPTNYPHNVESLALQTIHRSTGPRTRAGKERSKRNALKHGILSDVALLPNEVRAELDSVLIGLRDDLKPEGLLEEMLVEKLATLLWRYRRLLMAESAEIHKAAAFVEWNEKERQEEEAHEFSGDSLISRIANSRILEQCLGLLYKLKDEIESPDFEPESDNEILTAIYGDSEKLSGALVDVYETWCRESEDDERDSAKESKRNLLAALNKEIVRLNQYKKTKASVESQKMVLESVRQRVPDSPQVDRLLRYEASLDRSLDRTLTQLEKLQRMRSGQSVALPIKLDISSS